MPERPAGSDDVRLRHSLFLRLLALVTVVAVVAITVTAWLTVQTTTRGIREAQGEAVASGARITHALTSYAATHPDWSEVDPLLARLARTTGNRITLTDDTGHVVADSSPGLPLPAGEPTTIDALDVGAQPPAEPPVTCPDIICPVPPQSYVGPPPGDAPIDPRSVGPFELSPADRLQSRASAEGVADCVGTQVVATPTGRVDVDLTAFGRVPLQCGVAALLTPYPSEVGPLRRTQRLVDRCLDRHDGPVVDLLPSLAWTQPAARTPATDRVVTRCLTQARRRVLRPYVSPPMNLQVSSTRQEATTFLDLSAHNRQRIVGFALLVLVLAVGLTALVGRRLTRPLAALAAAAGRVRDGDLSARAVVSGRGEIGAVATAFNTMAEKREGAERLRKAMVGDVAHELRNPVSTMRGTLEAAQDGLVALDDALITSLLDDLMLLQHVVEDLRDLAAADAGDLRLTRGPVPLRALLTQVAADRATLVVHGEPTAWGDALRVRQIVGNLVDNALQHGCIDGVELRAHTSGAEVEITVTDRGRGIAAADLPHVFERFWRADASRSRNSGGSGLGLAIVAQLTQAHGGSVSVTSTSGAGSTFMVRLPAAP